MKISSGKNILNFLLFGALSFGIKAKLSRKFQLKVQNIDLSITITHTNTESSWLRRCRQ